MANIRVDLDYTIKDGSSVVFRSPCDCTEITGLIVYYITADGEQTSKEFSLADAHGENVGDIPHLFASDVVVKVILDVTKSMAFVQNADTNAYLEQKFIDVTLYATDPNNDGNIVLKYGGVVEGGGAGGTIPGGNTGGLSAAEVQDMIDASLENFEGVGGPGKDGEDGEDGYTPVKGVDYWTEEDKAEIKSYVDEAILGGAW